MKFKIFLRLLEIYLHTNLLTKLPSEIVNLTSLVYLGLRDNLIRIVPMSMEESYPGFERLPNWVQPVNVDL